MTLTSHTDFAAFLEAVQQCRGEVLFCTREGDKLNLKSTLSKYLFAALAGNEELLPRRKQNKWRLCILIRLSLVKKPNKIRKRHFFGNTA